jgi:hypothetical protein
MREIAHFDCVGESFTWRKALMNCDLEHPRASDRALCKRAPDAVIAGCSSHRTMISSISKWFHSDATTRKHQDSS